ncbi:hypothetical protein GOV14_02520 [Candidatus Pacearchaeota archaeon]|nr:hypothetical protein [Candidatus Pacearchaeota archaeon]
MKKGTLEQVLSTFATIFILLGIFIIIMQPFAPITGAVIDISTTGAKMWFSLGIISILIGAIIYVKIWLKHSPVKSRKTKN